MAAKLVVKNGVFLFNNTTLTAVDGTDLSAYIDSITLNANIDELEDTAFGASAKSATAGLEDNSIQINFMEGTSLATVQGVLWAQRGNIVYCSMKLTNAAIAVSNPAFQFQALVAGGFPIGGQVGQIAKMSLTFKIVSTITRATS